MIFGGRGGLLDRNYALAAQKIGTGVITTANALMAVMQDILPSDAEFEVAFAETKVSKSHLARYLLRALELKRKGSTEPEFVPSDDEQVINLEHILPENPDANWPGIDPDTAAAYYNRLGNLCILQATKNTLIGNSDFNTKKVTLKGSGYILTSDVAKNADWGITEINARQKTLEPVMNFEPRLRPDA